MGYMEESALSVARDGSNLTFLFFLLRREEHQNSVEKAFMFERSARI